MAGTALILGATGRFGRNAEAALRADGWETRAYDRASGDLAGAAKGADIIVNGWNPPYSKWAAQLPGLYRQLISAAEASGATILQPGNVYVFGFGPDLPEVLGPDTPHRATNDLGRLRIEIEAMLKASEAQVILLRGGDFLDNQPSAGWFDRIIAKDARAKGRLSYPGALDQPHAWAYLPDMTRALAALAGMRGELGRYTDLAFAGYTLTARDLAAGCGQALGREVSVSSMSWLPIQLARPFWAEAKHLLEMRYLWDQPHRIDGSALEALLPDLEATPLEEALAAALARADLG